MTEDPRPIASNRSLTGQNFIQQVRKEPNFTQPKFYKPLIFDVLAIISALMVGVVYSQFLGGTSGVGMLIVSLGIFSIISSIEIFLTKVLIRRIVVIVLQTVFMLIPFIGGYGASFLVAAGGISMFFVVWGELLAYGELENNMEIRFFKVSHRFFKKFTTALVLLMVFLFMPTWDSSRIFLPKENFQSLYTLAADTTKNFYSGVDFNSTFIALTRGLARVELQNTPTFKDLSDVRKEAIITDTASRIMADMSKNLGIEISSGDRTSDVFYNFILKLLTGLKDRFNELFLVAWALAVFLIIRGFGVIFYWIVMLVSFILYQLLLMSGFVHIVGISRTHENVEF